MWKTYKERVENEKELKHKLTEEDREVFRDILLHNRNENTRRQAFYRLHKIYSSNESNIHSSLRTSGKIDKLTEQASEEIIFSYCELYIDEGMKSEIRRELKDVEDFIKDMKKFFEVRGLLYNFEPNEKEDKIEIYPLASEKMRERHTEAKIMLLEEGWKEEADLISQAVSQFKKGESSYGSSLKSLYKALEISLKHTLLEINKDSSKEFKKKNHFSNIRYSSKRKFF